ncbi:hypothetical protein LTR37_011270 [Vermiconidia calcicola]|uniref:Uncharacterized protein n=1 Tax=Vermiconidia calcicola TaxID=1690605 RepID=A0ACC3N3L1_9PEZI|nr:hypothetical protein LTR37_011270 [Vermiconidia calcicola]
MKFTTAIVAALLSATSLAAPAESLEKRADLSMMAAGQWTITKMVRTCGNGECKWSFGINDGTTNTPCAFSVKGKPATQTDSTGNVCGLYTVSTGWSGQFGANNGFTTLAVANAAKKQIAYPAYTDAQLVNGTVVTPNQRYTPQNLAL